MAPANAGARVEMLTPAALAPAKRLRRVRPAPGHPAHDGAAQHLCGPATALAMNTNLLDSIAEIILSQRGFHGERQRRVH